MKKALCIALALLLTLTVSLALAQEVLGAAYLVPHTEGETVVYTFEAENTNLSNKSGPAASGAYVGEQMVLRGFGDTEETAPSNGYCVDGMCQYGVSINFVIVSDREVEDATLILRLGNECNFSFDLSSEDLLVRVDPVTEADLVDYTAGGAWGMWDSEFLDIYNDEILPFAGYYIAPFEEEPLTVTAEGTDPSGFEDWVVTTELKLWAGVNSISLITNNNRVPEGADNATMTAMAPIVDCIRIVTDAQLGLYAPQNNLNLGTDNACTFVPAQ